MSVESWKSFFDWSAVALVGLTFIAGFGALITGRILNDRQAAELANLKLSAAGANERASQADLKRVKLQNKMIDVFGPRQLTAEQSARIVKNLSGLDGVKIDVFVVDPGDSFTSSEDSVKLGLDIVRTLRAAKMEAEGWLMKDCPSGVQAANVSVFTLPQSSAKYKGIASQVLSAFQPEVRVASGVGNTVPYCTTVLPLDKKDSYKKWAGANDTTIGVAIGTKVQPILTREMLEPTSDKNP